MVKSIVVRRPRTLVQGWHQQAFLQAAMQRHQHTLLDRTLEDKRHDAMRLEVAARIKSEQIIVYRQMICCLITIIASLTLSASTEPCPWPDSFFARVVPGRAWLCNIFDFYQSMTRVGLSITILLLYAVVSYLGGAMAGITLCAIWFIHQTYKTYGWDLIYFSPPFAGSLLWSLFLRISTQRALYRALRDYDEYYLEWRVVGLRTICVELVVPLFSIAVALGCNRFV